MLGERLKEYAHIWNQEKDRYVLVKYELGESIFEITEKEIFMIYEFRLEAIIGIRDGELLYESGEVVKKISLKDSADIWWNKHHKATIWDKITKRKFKNRYAGGKWYNLDEPYIKMYSGDDEIVFKKKIPEDFETSAACELRMWWDDINVAMNQFGFWLFDEG